MRRRLAPLALALSVSLASCDTERITSADMGLSLEASISDASIGPGETATVTYRVRNVGRIPRAVAIGCSMLPFIEDGNGANVYPGGSGRWICAAVLHPPITLAPREEMTRTLHVNGDAASPPRDQKVSLRPGRYTLYIEFWNTHPDVRAKVRLRSRNVPFEVTG
jgi:hypothetical protein